MQHNIRKVCHANMGKQIQISIPESCRQPWDLMTPQGKGRHCDSCNKVVTDFTQMTDAQIFDLTRSVDNLCGKFYPDQLNRSISAPRRQMPFLKYFLTISIPAMLLSIKSSAQKIIYDTTVSQKLPQRMPSCLIGESTVVTGKVLDESGRPIEGASITIVGTNRGTATDSAGNFKINVMNPESILRCSGVGMSTVDEKINGRSEIYFIAPKIYSVAFGGAVVVTTRTIRKVKKTKENKINLNAAVINDLIVYPNPIATGQILHFKWTVKVAGKQHVQIFSADGHPVQSAELNMNGKILEGSVILKNLSSGFYIFKITDTETSKAFSKEFIVQ